MSQGVGAGPWPLQAPGSAASMTNFLPLDGKLIPRSRLSSLNTIRSMLTIQGLMPRIDVSGTPDDLWVSDATRHGVIGSNGSISVASFTSAFGLGVASIADSNFLWQYATVYYPGDADDMVLVAAPGIASYGTLTITYFAGANFRTSYLTSAPMAQCVGTFDNYVVAWNVQVGDKFVTRVQWCQRGSPSNWTGEGSGFEDLLEMRGRGNRVIGTQDNRLILFSTHEIWYGLPATYPAQFQFYPLERQVGLLAPHTAVETDLGIIFLGSDLNLRLLPTGGGPSRILAPQMREALQQVFATPASVSNNLSWAMFDPIQRLYYLYVDRSFGNVSAPFVLNVDTGEWGRIQHPLTTPTIGCAFTAPANSTIKSQLFYGNSVGTVSSANSVVATEDGTVVESRWQSGVLASDLHGAYKTVTNAHLDYYSSSTATVTVKVSDTGGTDFSLTAGSIVTLSPTKVAGRVEAQVYRGGGTPMIELRSLSTGYELHRMDVQMVIGGRP